MCYHIMRHVVYRLSFGNPLLLPQYLPKHIDTSALSFLLESFSAYQLQDHLLMPMLLLMQRINQDRIFLHFYRLFPDTLTALYGHGLDYLIILLRMADTSSGANLHPTPFRDSRYTFLINQARHGIALFIFPYKSIGGFCSTF